MPFWKKKKPKPPAKKTEVKKKPAPNPVKQSVPKKPELKPVVNPEIPKITHKPVPREQKLDPEKEFLDTFRKLTNRHRSWDIWQDFVVMAACALSNPVDKEHYDVREKRYLRIIKKYRKEEQNLFPNLLAWTVEALEENPEQDFLGKMYMQLNLGDHGKGQIFTPYHVCDLMASIAMGQNIADQVKEEGYITISDPCCGAGATLIAGVHEARKQLEKANLNFQNHVLVVAQDIDETVALMCYIQLSLLGVAGYVKVGNTLTEPIASGDSSENYWFMPMYFSDVWKTRRIFQWLSKLEDEGKDDSTL